MLQSMEAEVREVRRLFVTEEGEDAALVLEMIVAVVVGTRGWLTENVEVPARHGARKM
jgi:hypothetical protein